MTLIQSATGPVRLRMRLTECVTQRSLKIIERGSRSAAVRPALTRVRHLGSRSASTVTAASASEPSPVTSGTQLPKGVWWLDPASTQHDVLYGGNWSFVLQRPRRGGPGLVQMPAARLARRPSGREELGLALGSVLDQPAGLARLQLDRLSIMDSGIIIDTEATVVEDSVASVPSFLPASCLDIVRREETLDTVPSSPPDETEFIIESTSINPRRTKRIKFTCNLCGTTTIRPVNPRAWTHGSVFGRCAGCDIIHKLTDNLKVFHELKGAVYPGRRLKHGARVGLIIPPGLPQNPGAGLKRPPSGVRHPPFESRPPGS